MNRLPALILAATLAVSPLVRADDTAAGEPAMSAKDKVFALIRLNDSTQAELKQALADKDKALKAQNDALEAKIKDDAAARAVEKRLTTERDDAKKETADVKSTFGYRAEQFVKFWLKVIVSIVVGAYLIAFIGGFFGPATFIFKLAQWLISFLPAANVVEAWHNTVVVKARTVPVVTPPVVVADNSEVAQRLAEAGTAGAG